MRPTIYSVLLAALLLSSALAAAQTNRDQRDGAASRPQPDLVLTPAEVEAIGLAKRSPAPTPTPGPAENATSTSPPPEAAGTAGWRLGDWRDGDGPVRISLLDTAMKLAVLLLLLYGGLRLYRGVWQRPRPWDAPDAAALCVLQTIPMRGSKALHVVEAGRRTLLIADSGARLTVLADLSPLDDPPAVAHPERPRRAPSATLHAVAGAREGIAHDGALDWEDDHPPANEPSPETAASATRRSPDRPDPLGPNTISSRRALLLRALRSKEEARRQPAFAHDHHL
jgi:hypothetical protein